MHNITSTVLLCALASLAIGTQAATEERTTTTTTTVTDAQRTPNHQAADLAAAVQKDFRKDPLFRGLRIEIDLYKGLAIVHGAAPSEGAIALINDRLRSTPGIETVFNYMVSPEKQQAEPASISVSFDDFRRMQSVGLDSSAFTLGQRAKDRLDADPVLQQYDLGVDTYKGLLILHGSVPDVALARRAKDIAAYTAGTEAVLSYIDVSPAPELAPVTAAPILVRPATVEVITAPGETRGCEPCR